MCQGILCNLGAQYVLSSSHTMGLQSGIILGYLYYESAFLF